MQSFSKWTLNSLVQSVFYGGDETGDPVIRFCVCGGDAVVVRRQFNHRNTARMLLRSYWRSSAMKVAQMLERSQTIKRGLQYPSSGAPKEWLTTAILAEADHAEALPALRSGSKQNTLTLRKCAQAASGRQTRA
jgi:hypothetical protein